MKRPVLLVLIATSASLAVAALVFGELKIARAWCLALLGLCVYYAATQTE